MKIKAGEFEFNMLYGAIDAIADEETRGVLRNLKVMMATRNLPWDQRCRHLLLKSVRLWAFLDTFFKKVILVEAHSEADAKATYELGQRLESQLFEFHEFVADIDLSIMEGIHFDVPDNHNAGG